MIYNYYKSKILIIQLVLFRILLFIKDTVFIHINRIILNETIVFTQLRGMPYFGLAQLLYLKQLAFLALVNVTTYFDIPNIA